MLETILTILFFLAILWTWLPGWICALVLIGVAGVTLVCVLDWRTRQAAELAMLLNTPEPTQADQGQSAPVVVPVYVAEENRDQYDKWQREFYQAHKTGQQLSRMIKRG